jgi:predicted phage terminase large subunit-like protein
VNKEVTPMFLVMQRLHDRDPTGVVLKKAEEEHGTPVRHICIPSETEFDVNPPELKEKYVDGLMDPQRLPARVLQRERITLGEYWYCAQYGQKTMPMGGGMFKETYFINRVKSAPYHATRIRYIDRACLIAGTLIDTEREKVPIEQVREGDKVWTRKGLRSVVWSGISKYVNELCSVEFTSGSTLVGTSDHRVWTHLKNWVEMGKLDGEQVWTVDNQPSRAGRITVTPMDRYVPVYDLEVEGEPEFFANGVLVHNSTQNGGAFTAMVLLAKDEDGNYYVEHVSRGQWEPVERNKRIKAVAQRDRARYGPNHEPTIYVEAEPGSSGVDAWKEIARVLAGYKVKQDRPTGDKDTRAEPWSCQCAAGNVYLVDDGTWDMQAYIDEHTRFKPEPGMKRGRYKDQVDCSSGAFNLLVGVTPDRPLLRTYRIGPNETTGLRIVICARGS